PLGIRDPQFPLPPPGSRGACQAQARGGDRDRSVTSPFPDGATSTSSTRVRQPPTRQQAIIKPMLPARDDGPRPGVSKSRGPDVLIEVTGNERRHIPDPVIGHRTEAELAGVDENKDSVRAATEYVLQAIQVHVCDPGRCVGCTGIQGVDDRKSAVGAASDDE